MKKVLLTLLVCHSLFAFAADPTKYKDEPICWPNLEGIIEGYKPLTLQETIRDALERLHRSDLASESTAFQTYKIKFFTFELEPKAMKGNQQKHIAKWIEETPGLGVAGRKIPTRISARLAGDDVYFRSNNFAGLFVHESYATQSMGFAGGPMFDARISTGSYNLFGGRVLNYIWQIENKPQTQGMYLFELEQARPHKASELHSYVFVHVHRSGSVLAVQLRPTSASRAYED